MTPASRVVSVTLTDDTLSADIDDGRTISVPIGWYPRLANGTPAERANFQISGAGYGIHWPELERTSASRGCCLGRSPRKPCIISKLAATARTDSSIERRRDEELPYRTGVHLLPRDLLGGRTAPRLRRVRQSAYPTVSWSSPPRSYPADGLFGVARRV